MNSCSFVIIIKRVGFFVKKNSVLKLFMPVCVSVFSIKNQLSVLKKVG
ncbi:hypothetical protein HMPREF9193_02146 [Treponema lecithinolyticum ATCC 700332]|uniref:Uncharacterized protein n=1 Tax=Treponema lecithinolyticum ATCC 700332 TaxID=1321815 RepID=A0ABN0NWN8_TRELE|nr:hypothetical protein HMPREF9193_02146 [Treponema lecithinolyticum ATCC 700332]